MGYLGAVCLFTARVRGLAKHKDPNGSPGPAASPAPGPATRNGSHQKWARAAPGLRSTLVTPGEGEQALPRRIREKHQSLLLMAWNRRAIKAGRGLQGHQL